MGTEIDGKWWKRYRKDKLLMRGNGEYWCDGQGFYFRRYLTTEPIFIPFRAIRTVKLGAWHSGRWAFGQLILKIIWEKENLCLSSGFIISKDLEATRNLKDFLEQNIIP